MLSIKSTDFVMLLLTCFR